MAEQPGMSIGMGEAIVLVRALAAGEAGLTRSTLLRDLQPLVAHKLTPAEWRARLDNLLLSLSSRDLLHHLGRGRMAVTQHGRDTAWQFLRIKPMRSVTWPQLKNGPLVARALGGTEASASRLKPIQKAHGLRAAIIERTFSLKLRSVPAPARLRDALAKRALRDGKAKPPSGRTDADTSRALAANMLARPRKVGTDTQLISLIAAEQAGSVQGDIAALRMQLLRDLMFDNDVEMPAPPALKQPQQKGATLAPPTLERFVQAVRTLAQDEAQGWSGNRRAYISHVWRAFGANHGDWAMNEAGFKSMLTQAHKAGQLQLTNADLRDRKSLADIQASAVAYMNSVWHFIRVEDC